MMRWLSISLMPMLSLSADHLSKHLKKIEPLSQVQQIEHIDCIYLINLDSRPEKLRACVKQLDQYHLAAYRFSAVIGKEISESAMQELGMEFKPGMAPVKGKFFPGQTSRHLFNERTYGKICFYKDFSKGALGCTLSHLSILQHAYDSGYETIWVLEDDFLINQDPHILSEYIMHLDEWMGKENWDILHTDDASYFTSFGDRWRPDYIQIVADFVEEHPEWDQEYVRVGDPYADDVSKIHSWWVKRIKMSAKHYGMIRAYPDMDLEFRYITGRFATHSMIIRRSGMKKILDFEKRYGIFLPYDNEISVVPFLKMFNLKSNIVTLDQKALSDTGAR